MSKSEFELALTQLAAERGLPKDKVVAAVEAALASAYRKESQTSGQNIIVRLDGLAGTIRLFTTKTVVDAVTDAKKEMTVQEARQTRPSAKVGEEVEVELIHPSSARIAALTVKQVVLQRLREAERDLIYGDYLTREGEMVPGRVERAEPGRLVVTLGKAESYLPREEQVQTERYRTGTMMQFYLLEVRKTTKGPELILSRTHRNLLRRLLEREVPEIFQGTVEIKAIAREAGSRSKVAVAARQEGVDPVGSCIGPRGVRIQNVVNELQGEKIDVFQWNKDPRVFIANAMNPAQVMKVDLNEDDKVAVVVVPDNQLSLAIGRDGQTARLTAKLTGLRIDVKGAAEYEALRAAAALKAEAAAAAAAPAPVAPPPPAELVPTEAVIKEAPPKVEEAPVPVAEAPAPAAPVAAAPVAPAPEPVKVEEPKAPTQAAPVKEAVPVPAGEDVWALGRILRRPTAPESGVLRFAEEILPGRGKSREGPDSAPDDAAVARAKPKRARRSRPAQDEEDTGGADTGGA
jgi:N utilization substance protein A